MKRLPHVAALLPIVIEEPSGIEGPGIRTFAVVTHQRDPAGQIKADRIEVPQIGL